MDIVTSESGLIFFQISGMGIERPVFVTHDTFLRSVMIIGFFITIVFVILSSMVFFSRRVIV